MEVSAFFQLVKEQHIRAVKGSPVLEPRLTFSQDGGCVWASVGLTGRVCSAHTEEPEAVENNSDVFPVSRSKIIKSLGQPFPF